jgi:hypothetical protein
MPVQLNWYLLIWRQGAARKAVVVAQDAQAVSLVKYSIDAKITEESLLDLLPELQRAGAEGVVQRITLLREQGVIENDS